jgi:RNA polymerase sigma-70 factor (ECF subfamily)
MDSMAIFFKRQKALEAEIDWDLVYQDYLPRVYNFFRYRVGDDALAEDLTSVTFEKAWRARKGYRRDISKVATWLFAIARNVRNDHFRGNRLEVQLDALEQVADSFLVEENSQQGDESHRLEILLKELNARDRELVSLKYGAEMTNREIAQVTGLSESNVGTILNRVVTKLRNAWEM